MSPDSVWSSQKNKQENVMLQFGFPLAEPILIKTLRRHQCYLSEKKNCSEAMLTDEFEHLLRRY